ncbi:MAG: septal ring lytic transglycosylase RlpA family protein [Gammaproteobacteria bacterium]|nr:septal ring lytic transglycosylase RlpA family protein [Gammaproteobacteria bacterium]MBQ0841057.1 septal ring lytic transglycosylase RlpA family protein [Gammaproteobacteria bacterium]
MLGSLLLAALSGCQSGDSFARIKDSGPVHEVDVSQLADAVPRVDPITIAGNKNPYTVNGVTYQLMPSAKGYSEEGMASWYGNKFHGRKTSNGETYSMYGMTAAHKTLPIPAYVRVTNVANGRQIIVRVNDRGPFHGGRIIDLSYAGAKKLGYANNGTARVRVETIDPANFQPNSVSLPTLSAQLNKAEKPRPLAVATQQAAAQPFLQIGVYSSMNSARQLQKQLAAITTFPVSVRRFGEVKTPVFKVWIGPIVDQLQLAALRNRLIQQGRYKPFVVNAVREI